MSDTIEIPGSTLTPTTTVTPKVITFEVETDRLKLNGTEVDGVSQTTDMEAAEQVKNLATVFALNTSMQEVERDMEDLQSSFDNFYYAPVLSDPILDPFFVDVKWEISGFSREDSHVVFTSQLTDTAYLRILSDAFTNPGKYFIYFSIASLPHGSLQIVDQSDVVYKTYYAPGTYALEVDIDQPSIALIDFIVSGLEVNDTCQIDWIYVHHVKTAFGRYMDYMAGKLLSGGSGFASEAYVQLLIQQSIQASQTYTNSLVGEVATDITSHTTNVDNPHDTTYLQTGAAAAEHTHTPDECGAAPVVHAHQASEVEGVSILGHTHTPEECGAASVSHTHTPASIGAASVNHTHQPEECGAAAVVHQHDAADIPYFVTVDQHLADLDAALAASDTTADLQLHLQNVSNPHQVTKVQVELGDVVNAPMATLQEAVEGVLEDRYMNPKTVRESLVNLFGTEALDTSKLIPVPIQTLSWSNTGSIFSIPIFPNRIYKLAITCKDELSLKNLGISIDLPSGNPDIRNNVCMAKTLTLLSGESIKVMGWDQSEDDHFKLMLDTLGINKAHGELTLHTNNMTLTGIMHGYVIDEATHLEVTTSSYPYLVSSCFAPDMVPTDYSVLRFYPLLGTLNMDVNIYELMQPTQEPNMVIDATPVGTIVTRYGTSIVPGWVRTDGSELSRTLHPELWAYAQMSGSLVTESDWQADMVANGTTHYFSEGDGVSTFRVPMFELHTALYTYIKSNYAQIQQSDEILYRFIWEN